MALKPRLKPAIFLDKDGTLIENIPWNVDPARIVFTVGAIHGLKLLHEAGYAFVVVSNQAGVAQGRFTLRQLDAVGTRLREMLASCGIPLAGCYWCPHDPHGKVKRYAFHCTCRKPSPGLVTFAARDKGLDLSRSWLIGDILDDVEAGRRAGCRTVLLDNGNETRWEWSAVRRPHFIVNNLGEAASIILAAGSGKHGRGETRP
jgi:histidinol-phosphate phosphatase family protein